MDSIFLKTLYQYQTEIEKETEKFFQAQIKGAKTPFLRQTLKILKEFSLRPGKKIRSILIMQGYFLAGGKNKKEILKTSVFIELIHNFLLIHDDILDKEEFRRKKPTLHRIYQKEGSEHYGTSMAIVAGDMMEFLGRKILAQSKFSDNLKIKAVEKLNQVLIAVAYGEMFEFWLKEKFKDGKTIEEKDILDIYKTKTASYTFVGPLQMGALLAGAGKKLLEWLEKIGLNLGIAFQIKDDFDDAERDLKEGQPTLLRLKNPEECRQIAEKLIKAAKKEILAAKYKKEESEFLLNLADYIIERKD